MRYILIILVFLSVGANAQMVIKAHANYRPYAQPAANFLLDDYPNAAAAYSLRKLDKDYTGAAIRVRKDTTGQPEQDIGFTASGDLDTAALKSFLNARSGFVVTWYNQADSAGVFGVRNMTQATAASQPRIALNGVIDRVNGKVALNHNPGFFRSYTLSFTSEWSAFTIVKPNNIANSVPAYTQSNTSSILGQITVGYGRSNKQFMTWLNMFLTNSTNDITTNTQLFSYFKRGSTSNWNYDYYKDGVANGTFTTTANSGAAPTNSYMAIGAYNTANPNSSYMEIIVYPSNQSSNRTGIESNINTYYGIY